jgi:hypothetical protein
MPYPQGLHLTPRDLKILFTVGKYKLLTSHQLCRLHFPTGNHETATNRLTALARANYLSRVFSYPTATTTSRGHPTAVFYWTPQNQQTLKTYLEANGQASDWEDFAPLLATNNKSNEYSHLYLKHETAISDFFLTLEDACARPEARASIVFWERTSPLSNDIGATLQVEITRKTNRGKPTTEKRIRPVNPDAFFCLQNPNRSYSFFFLEYDNNTSTTERFRQKLFAYLAYRNQKKFPPLLERYKQKYQLPLTTTDKAGFRVLILTPDEKRRNTLYLDSLKLKSFTMLLYASLKDLTPQTILSTKNPAWMRGKEYTPIAAKEKALAPDIAPEVKSRWLQEQLSKMPRVSLIA